MQVSQRLVANAARATILPDTYPSSLFRNAFTSMSQWKPVLVTMFRAFNATVVRGRKRESLRGKGSHYLFLSYSSSERIYEGMEIDNIPLFEPVSPRPYGVFFYHVNSWLDFFQIHFKGWTTVLFLLSFVLSILISRSIRYSTMYYVKEDINYVQVRYCSTFWTVLYDILKSRNSWTIIERGIYCLRFKVLVDNNFDGMT